MARRRRGRSRRPRRNKRYRFTPARRAALKRAQKISARKRRKARVKRTAKTGAVIVGSLIVSAGVSKANYAINHPVKSYKKTKSTGRKARQWLGTKRAKGRAPTVVTPQVKKHPIGYYPSRSTQRAAARRFKRGRI